MVLYCANDLFVCTNQQACCLAPGSLYQLGEFCHYFDLYYLPAKLISDLIIGRCILDSSIDENMYLKTENVDVCSERTSVRRNRSFIVAMQFVT